MKRLIIVILIQTGTLIVSGCTDHGSDVGSNDHTGQPLTLKVTPDSGVIGTVVAIRGLHISGSAEDLVRFPGADDWLVADSSMDSTIYTFVPFGAVSGPLSVSSGQLLGHTGQFRVTESVDTTALTAAKYNLSPFVTANDSSVIDRMGFRRAWRADRQGDTIHISRGYSTGEEYREYHLVLFAQATDQFPRIFALWTHIKPDYPGAQIDTIRAGILKIQEYSTSGIISGRFYGRPSLSRMLNGTFAFWVDLRR